MIYEANYANGTKTVTQDFSVIVAFVRDTHVSAKVSVWDRGNEIMIFDLNHKED